MAIGARKPRDYFTTREAAKRLGVSLTTVQLWVESGALPAWKTAGGHRRIPCAAVESMVLEMERSSGGSDLRLLVVEDEPVQRELYRRQIPQWSDGIKLVIAENGFEGLMAAGRAAPQVIITDLDMPGMDGFQMIQHLAEQLPEIKELLVVTGLSSDEIEHRGGLPAKALVYRKPAPFDQLRGRVLRHLPAHSLK